MIGTQNHWVTSRAEPVPKPAYRRLRGYAFDPSLSTRNDTAMVNEVVFKVPWEDEGKRERSSDSPVQFLGPDAAEDRDAGLWPGPIGEYLEVIDYDPASGCFYEPINLNSPLVLAQDGLAPTEGNPQFHQQMVYAVAMTTIHNFERALGRFALWGPNPEDHSFVRRLRIYPHALREANAYYSPAKKALLFGYFPATSTKHNGELPGEMVFTCLSHDVIAHETTHALLDGMHRRWIENAHPDSLAFHEAFADIVALFQHFTFPEVLRHQIARTRGDLASQNALGQLARQVGRAIGLHGSLRDAIGAFGPDDEWRPQDPKPEDYERVLEPHARGAILVAAVFDAFTTIYRGRVADLVRIASSGTGVLPQGELHPDLVNRLAQEAATAAQHVLEMCIRALDYCPPVDVTFGDYLRAIITADSDLVPDDARGYRVAFIEAFRRRGIFPDDVRTFSAGSLRWAPAMRGVEGQQRIEEFARLLKQDLVQLRDFATTREAYHEQSQRLGKKFHEIIEAKAALIEEVVDGALLLTRALPDTADADARKFEVHSVRPAQRAGRGGNMLNHAIVSITQKRTVTLLADDESPDAETFSFRGGATLIINLDTLGLEYAIGKGIVDDERLAQQRRWRQRCAEHGRGAYMRRPPNDDADEPFALLHRPSPDLDRGGVK